VNLHAERGEIVSLLGRNGVGRSTTCKSIIGLISGGEKQMLTICRTLMGDPDLITIDEPTEGLAPMLVDQMGKLIEEIARRKS
jgi:ABC-type branched-subunit amino acid transport system ATPase component